MAEAATAEPPKVVKRRGPYKPRKRVEDPIPPAERSKLRRTTIMRLIKEIEAHPELPVNYDPLHCIGGWAARIVPAQRGDVQLFVTTADLARMFGISVEDSETLMINWPRRLMPDPLRRIPAPDARLVVLRLLYALHRTGIASWALARV